MAATVQIQFDTTSQTAEFTTQTCGRALRDPRCKVNKTASTLGLTPVCQYFAADSGQWFSVTEGLFTVRGLLAKLRAEPFGVCNPLLSIHDLEQIETALSANPCAQFRLNLGG